MANPQIELGWNNAALQAGAAQAERTVNGFARQTEARLTSVGKTQINFAGLTGPLIGAIAATAGLKSMVDEFDRLNDLANQLNTSPESLQRLGAQAKLSGSDVEEVAKSMIKLGRSLRDADNPKAAAALAQLGLSAGQLLALQPEQQVALLVVTALVAVVA